MKEIVLAVILIYTVYLAICIPIIMGMEKQEEAEYENDSNEEIYFGW